MRAQEEQQRRVLFCGESNKGALKVRGGQDGSAGSASNGSAASHKHHNVFRGKGRVPLRKGKWTPEEEAYANRIIFYFNQGMLAIPAGTTLRSYLSERLNCDPMRITKKFAGASCIGKQVFSPCEQTTPNVTEMRRCEDELCRLENVFVERLEQKGTVTFDLNDHGMSKESKHVQEWFKNTVGAGRHPSTRTRGAANGTTHGSSMKRATSAPDLAELAQLRDKDDKRRRLSAADDEAYTVDDKAAGDLLLEFFRKLHEDHAQSDPERAMAIPEPIATGLNDSKLASPALKRKFPPRENTEVLSGITMPSEELVECLSSEEHKSSDSSSPNHPRPFPNTSPHRGTRATYRSGDDDLDLPMPMCLPSQLASFATREVSAADPALSCKAPLAALSSPRPPSLLSSPALKRHKSEPALQDMGEGTSAVRVLSPRSCEVACWILKLRPPNTPPRVHMPAPLTFDEDVVRSSAGAQTRA